MLKVKLGQRMNARDEELCKNPYVWEQIAEEAYITRPLGEPDERAAALEEYARTMEAERFANNWADAVPELAPAPAKPS